MTEINTFLQQLASDANKVDLFLFLTGYFTTTQIN